MSERANNIPKHIAIIMDGNRRWAKKRNLTPVQGHRAGADTLKKIVEHCQKRKIKYLTVYTLSTENIKNRSAEEVKNIFNLLVEMVREKKQEYIKEKVKLNVLGDIDSLPLFVKRAIKEIVSINKDKFNLQVNLALNYGGRDEIIRAIKQIVKEGVKSSQINEKTLGRYLYTLNMPDPDLVIRTGGDYRISNFLLWQSSYSEFYFSKHFWPDFSPEKLDAAIAEFGKRERRRGK
jgi:undecaprenyl diphosphate synthase